MTQYIVKVSTYTLIDAPSEDYAKGLVMGSVSQTGPKGIPFIQIVEGCEGIDDPLMDINAWFDETGGF